MTRSQKLNRCAVFLMVGGTLLSIIGWLTVFSAVWLVAVLMVGAGWWLMLWVEACEARAAHEAAVNVLEDR